jgi:hypothetical protein
MQKFQKMVFPVWKQGARYHIFLCVKSFAALSLLFLILKYLSLDIAAYIVSSIQYEVHSIQYQVPSTQYQIPKLTLKLILNSWTKKHTSTTLLAN